MIVAEGKLLVADAWHHRILVWNRVPTESNQPPDGVIGQDDASQVLPNRGAGPTAKSLYWPYGMAYVAGRFYVADTGNRRVLGWKGIPNGDAEAHLVLGQTDANASDENRGGNIGGDTFRWPHAIAGDENGLWIADAGNHRVLGWRGHPEADRPSDFVLGQESMSEAREWPYDIQGAIAFVFRMGWLAKRGCWRWPIPQTTAFFFGSCRFLKMFLPCQRSDWPDRFCKFRRESLEGCRGQFTLLALRHLHVR